MELKKSYLHVERLDKEEVEGILNGTCHVFPKLDGTNASVWADEWGNIHCGSRNREINQNKDNAGFAEYVMSADYDDPISQIRLFCIKNPNKIVFGEWLCQTKLGKNYINKRKFFVFDVFNCYEPDDTVPNGFWSGYEDWETYSDELLGYPYLIPPIDIIDNPTEAQLKEIAENNHFNLPDNIIGEGIVIKNYDFRNKYGHYEVAKIVRDEFKADKSKKTIMPNEYEAMFLEQCVTPVLMQKCKDKVFIALGSDELTNKSIGMITGMVWKDAIEEEMYQFIKKNKHAVVDFGSLNRQVNAKVRDFLGL